MFISLMRLVSSANAADVPNASAAAKSANSSGFLGEGPALIDFPAQGRTRVDAPVSKRVILISPYLAIIQFLPCLTFLRTGFSKKRVGDMVFVDVRNVDYEKTGALMDARVVTLHYAQLIVRHGSAAATADLRVLVGIRIGQRVGRILQIRHQVVRGPTGEAFDVRILDDRLVEF